MKRKVEEGALRDEGELERLFRGAVARGWVRATVRDRLWFWTAAEYALRVSGRGTNPGDLFVWLVRGEHRDRPGERDEMIAMKRLKRKEELR